MKFNLNDDDVYYHSQGLHFHTIYFWFRAVTILSYTLHQAERQVPVLRVGCANAK